MPDLQNPSFEVIGASEGHADAWYDTQDTGTEEAVIFDGDPGELFPWEDFDNGWATGWQSAFDTLDLVQVLFEGGTRPREDFEVSWGDPTGSGPPYNHQALTAFDTSNLLQVLFDTGTPEPREDFEEEWSNNQFAQAAFTGGDLTAISFDTGVPEPLEDFEEEWSNNQLAQAAFGGGDLVAISFDSGVPEPVEDFEEEWFETLNL
ncbi:MAG: hypothetical protein FJ098_00730 [Deltaproteobacteria bacterium]|nr:hypothetical protein [Deltaproteobacteria bacterium]